MSRIGNCILTIPTNTSITLEANNLVTVTGIKGSLKELLPNVIKINVDKNKNIISTIRPIDNKKSKQLHSTANS